MSDKTLRTNDSQRITIQQVIEAGAVSSLQNAEPPLEHLIVTPVLTGWAACIFALEGNGSHLVRGILKKESSEGENTVEHVIFGRKPEEQPPASDRERSNHETTTGSAPRESYASIARRERTVKLVFQNPFHLDLRLSHSALKDCYVTYDKPALDGTPRYFRLLSGPLFVLTRISLAMAAPKNRKEIWKQLLVYLSSVKGLPEGDLRNSFHSTLHEKWLDQEKWLELVSANPNSTIIGVVAHEKMIKWLQDPLDHTPRRSKSMKNNRKATFKTTQQEFKEIAASWQGADLDEEVIYDELVRLREALRDEFNELSGVLKKRLEIARASSGSGTLQSHNNSLSHSISRWSSPYFPRNRRP
ncbi:hypothetical protein JCM3765_007653 [Sporobolomyces pararoseus]